MKTKFRESYHVNPRKDVFELVPKDVKRVLDVGCGAGELGRHLKEAGVKEVVGIELNEKAAEIASHYLDNVLVGNVEETEMPFDEGYFDCIIYADILEHLVDPWTVLSKHKKFLADNGCIIISIPNVRHIHTFLNLLRGEWNYADRGIFDKTHLRFFTLKSITKALKDCGFTITDIIRNYRLFEGSIKYASLAKLISCYLFRDFFVFQYLIVSKRSDKI